MAKGRPTGLNGTETEILRAAALASTRRHSGEFWAYELGKIIKENSGRAISWGTLFPALRRLESRELMTSDWESDRSVSPGGRTRRYYRLTDNGLTEAGVSAARPPAAAVELASLPC